MSKLNKIVRLCESWKYLKCVIILIFITVEFVPLNLSLDKTNKFSEKD